MRADAIINRVLEDARAQAAQMLKEAEERAEQYRVKADQEIVSKREETMDQARRECVELRDRMLRMAELDQRKVQLGVKRDLIDQAFQKALNSMREMSDADKLTYISRTLAEIASGDEEVIVSAADAALFSGDALQKVNAALAAQGKPGKLTLSAERRETGGGFILKKSSMEINCTFEAMLGQVRPSLESSVADMLFADAR